MFGAIYVLPWNHIALLMPIMTVLGVIFVWLVKQWCKNELRVYAWVFFVWFFLVLFDTTIRREANVREADLLLFGSYIRASKQPELYRANFMNVLLFFPGGMSLAFVIYKVQKMRKKLLSVLVILCVMSIFIEVIQFVFALGMTETDDVLHNTLGGILGYGAAMLSLKVSNVFDKLVKKRGKNHNHTKFAKFL